MSDLATHEADSLAFQESVIERGRKTFVEVGKALSKIRDSRLYRETHETFEDYCKERWGWARATAYQYIDASETVENVRNCGHTEPSTESHARPLTKLPAEDQPKAWERANKIAEEEGKPVAARHVKVAVEEIKPAEPTKKLPSYTPSSGEEFAVMAIAQLERIQPNDNQKKDALNGVINYCNKRINE